LPAAATGSGRPDLDEDLSIEGLLRGAPAPKAAVPGSRCVHIDPCEVGSNIGAKSAPASGDQRMFIASRVFHLSGGALRRGRRTCPDHLPCSKRCEASAASRLKPLVMVKCVPPTGGPPHPGLCRLVKRFRLIWHRAGCKRNFLSRIVATPAETPEGVPGRAAQPHASIHSPEDTPSFLGRARRPSLHNAPAFPGRGRPRDTTYLIETSFSTNSE
jgi:hypothetical protein